ncbi:MAG: group 1 glycosyl transferase [uncultured bacterium]|nr:MAG: group 1 glycosyl transferase [uncultured bacterium]
MLIGIDGSRAVKFPRTGTEKYSFELIKAFTKLVTKHQFVIYLSKDPLVENNLAGNEKIFWRDLPSNFKIKVIERRRLWTLIGLSNEMRNKPPEVLFVPAHVLPVFLPPKSVVTLHGTEYRECPASYRFRERLYLNYTTRRSLKKASKIICVSETAKKNFLKYYPRTDANKIVVIRHGVNTESLDKISGRYQLPFSEPYLLFIGTQVPRKNLRYLIEEFQYLAKDFKLVIAGKKTTHTDKLKELGRKLKIEKDVYWLDYLGESEKWQLLKSAKALIEPSKAAGFGMTIYEAMAVKTPVCLAENDLFREVGKDAAYYFDTEKPGDLASRINEMETNQKRLQEKIDQGFTLAQNASWHKVALSTLDSIIRC